MYDKNDTMKDKNINISSLKKNFENLIHTYWADGNRNTAQQKEHEVRASERNIDLEQ